MDNETAPVFDGIAALHSEVENLREGYVITNQRYMDALELIQSVL